MKQMIHKRSNTLNGQFKYLTGGLKTSLTAPASKATLSFNIAPEGRNLPLNASSYLLIYRNKLSFLKVVCKAKAGDFNPFTVLPRAVLMVKTPCCAHGETALGEYHFRYASTWRVARGNTLLFICVLLAQQYSRDRTQLSLSAL